MTAERFSRLSQLMNQNNLQYIVLNPGATLTYLTGLRFHLMERPTVLLVKNDDDPILILPELEVSKVSASPIKLKTIPYSDDPSSWQNAFNAAADMMDLDGKTIGVEPTSLRFLEINFLNHAAPHAHFVSASQILDSLRIQKDAVEIEAMRQAVIIAQNALQKTIPFIKPGVSEREIAAELITQLYKAGSGSELPFAPIIASGPNSANPHAVPTDRRLKRGDLLVIDWGASYNGYFSDLTRTFAIGSASDELRAIYSAVQGANAAGRAAGKPGISAGSVDSAAREVIERAGFGQFFTHRTGHGLGMAEHETPYIFAANDLQLATGMTYTVEPGIYLPGKGGVRIEDNVVITPDGCESLSDMSRDLLIL